MKITDEIILKLFLCKGGNVRPNIKNKLSEEFKKYLEIRYDYFNGDYTFVIHLIKNGFKEWPKCKNCGKYLNKRGKHFCSAKCSASFGETQTKRKNTCFKNNGYISPFSRKDVKEKAKQTIFEHYGVENPFQAEEVKQTIKDTMLETYGKEYYVQTDDFKEKSKNTCLEHFGVEFSGQSEQQKTKMKQTNLKLYGNVCSLHGEDVQKKVENTLLKHYGVKHYAQSEEFHHRRYKRYFYDNIYFYSQDELAFYIYNKDRNYDRNRTSWFRVCV